MADDYTPGFRDFKGKPQQLPTLYGSPLTMLKAIGRFSRDDIGAGTGLPYKGTKDELKDDWLRRWKEFERDYPQAYPYFADEVPKDALERLDRAHDLGFRVPGSRGMHQNELGGDAGFSDADLRKAMGQDYTPTVATRIGRHADLSQDLIGPAAAHFARNKNHAAVPLLLNAMPASTLITTDTEANSAYALAMRLQDEDMMSELAANFVVDGRGEQEKSARLRRWLTDNGYTALLYPNEVEGSPRSDSPQNKVMSTMGVRAGTYLQQMPFYQRSEAITDIPNPSLVVLEPANLRHQMADFDPKLAKKIGYKLGVPLAGGMAGLKYLQGSEAQAGTPGDDHRLDTDPLYNRMVNSFNPHDVDEMGAPVTDSMDRTLDRNFTTDRANNAMKSTTWWEDGLSKTALDLLATPMDLVGSAIGRAQESRVEQPDPNIAAEAAKLPDLEAQELLLNEERRMNAIKTRRQERAKAARDPSIPFMKRDEERGPMEHFLKDEVRNQIRDDIIGAGIFTGVLGGGIYAGKQAYRVGKKGLAAGKKKIGEVYEKVKPRFGRVLELDEVVE